MSCVGYPVANVQGSTGLRDWVMIDDGGGRSLGGEWDKQKYVRQDGINTQGRQAVIVNFTLIQLIFDTNINLHR